MASNVLTMSARGNVSYAVSLTTCSTLLAPLVVPAALWLFLGESQSIDPMAEARQLLLTVVFPVLLGHVMSRFWPRAQKVMHHIAPAVANLTIVWIIACVAANNRERLIPNPRLVAALLLVNVIGYAAGYFGGRLLRLPEAMTRALTLVVGMQNAGLGTVIAMRLFEDRNAVAIPSAIYTVASVYTALLLAFYWSRRDARRLAEPAANRCDVPPAGV
jgi:BASS family bile acid:Na+ symporter